ncbi:MAG TPA: hypothetical protein DCL61_15360, partial [Cyanobacteria bacterium UBA12227]|nr:hypothetical protein [Cyanobacteria bacterium UBA12227]
GVGSGEWGVGVSVAERNSGVRGRISHYTSYNYSYRHFQPSKLPQEVSILRDKAYFTSDCLTSELLV